MERANKRNAAWNEFGAAVNKNSKTLDAIQAHMHRIDHDTETFDVEFVVLIDRCIVETEDILKKLKKLRQAVSVP